MKVAIPTMQSGMNGRVGNLEDCPYLVVSGLGKNDVDLVENPLIVLEPQDFARETSMTPWLIEEGVQVLLVAQCDWEAPLYLGRAGIQVIEGVQGTVQSALKWFRQFCMSRTIVISSNALEN